MKDAVVIKGFENYTIDKDGIVRNAEGTEICRWKDNIGYLQVNLFKDGKRYYKRIHRLVAETFIGNENNLKQVNHKDGDKTNNRADNLEWIDNKNNTQHGYNNNLYHTKKRCIGVEVFSKEGDFICIYKSIRETADKLNINRKTLSRILFDDKTNNYEYNFKAVI